VGVIDAAIIRHESRTTAQLQQELTTAKETIAATPAATHETRKGWLQRFGLPLGDDVDWRSQPPLKAKVVKWESANRFILDNGQVWEGYESIPYELAGKNIEIQARPHEQFALTVEGKNTTLRVIRLR